LKSIQQARVLGYLRAKGSITSLQAIQHYGITRLSAVIFDMIEKGHVFEKEHQVKVTNRFGEVNRVTRYHYKGMKNKESS
tara:strand:+ start:567 stop:806 length:240 start_codon:yes stop_codon:yes gene_type:complete